jgi:hypothetical protein
VPDYAPAGPGSGQDCAARNPAGMANARGRAAPGKPNRGGAPAESSPPAEGGGRPPQGREAACPSHERCPHAGYAGLDRVSHATFRDSSPLSIAGRANSIPLILRYLAEIEKAA